MRRGAAVAAAAGVVAVAAVGALAGGRDEPAGPACRSQRRPVVLNLPNARFQGILRHVWAATAHGQPVVLHVARGRADAHRAASLRGIPTWLMLPTVRRQRLDPAAWRLPHDRDEYPPAFSAEGGARADVAYVVAAENRGAGSLMQQRLGPFCDGQAWRFELKPGPRTQAPTVLPLVAWLQSMR